MSHDHRRHKYAKTTYPIHELLQQRWSPRAFADQPVETDTLHRLLEAARWAPSCFNEQPWRFIIATRDDPEAYDQLLHTLVERNQQWAHTAPVLMLTVTKTTFAHNDKPNRHAWHDAGLALAQLILQATAEGLSVHPMAGFKRKHAREVYAIPDDYEPVAAVAIGYVGDPEILPESFQKMETSPRTRHPLAIYRTKWGEEHDLM